jgi:hypothetical protein
LVGRVLVIGETRRESVAAASILWVVVCVVVCVEKEKIVNRTAHFFRFSRREFSFEKLILVQVHLNGYGRAQVWPSAATAQREWTPAILPTSSTLLKPILKNGRICCEF